MISGTARVRQGQHGWFAVFELVDSEPVSSGPYESRALAEQRRDNMINEILETTRANGVNVEVLELGDLRVLNVVGGPERMRNARTTPNPSEEQLAYEMLRPFPFAKSPHGHVAELLCGYREGIVERVLEPLANRLPPREAARLRRAIKVIRGELRLDDLHTEDTQ